MFSWRFYLSVRCCIVTFKMNTPESIRKWTTSQGVWIKCSDFSFLFCKVKLFIADFIAWPKSVEFLKRKALLRFPIIGGVPPVPGYDELWQGEGSGTVSGLHHHPVIQHPGVAQHRGVGPTGVIPTVGSHPTCNFPYQSWHIQYWYDGNMIL